MQKKSIRKESKRIWQFEGSEKPVVSSKSNVKSSSLQINDTSVASGSKGVFVEFKAFFSKRVLTYILICFVLVSFLLLFFAFFLNEELSSLKAEHEAFVLQSNNNIYSLNESISVLEKQNSDLNLNLINLRDSYDSLSTSNTLLNKSYSDLKNEANITITKIEDYELNIKKSLDWFQANSMLDDSHRAVLLNLKSNCLEKSSLNCEINLGCFFLVNSEFLDYTYKLDSVTSDSVDKLQSLNDFIKNKGGDCEDYSLFFKAEFNSLVEGCGDKRVNLFGWVEKKGSTFWANTSDTWYMSDATKKYFDKNNLFPLVVCGSMFDPKSSNVNGHCVIALNKIKIFSSDDVSSLESAELIEPQTGEYLGFVGQDSGIYLVSQNPDSTSYIDTLITDNDFFLYRHNKWNNYSEFGTELAQRKKSLEELLIE
ncbi:MAG: hypothetical protein WC462_00710 [archaeon]